MSLPTQLKTTRMTDATTGDQIDNQVANLETAICDMFGVPIDTDIANAGFLWDATGLKKTIFQDNAADPNAVGQIARNGKILKFHDGGVRSIPLSLAGDAVESVVHSTASPQTLYSATILGGTLGTTGMIDGYVDLFINSILNGSNLTIALSYGGQTLTGPQLSNATGSTQSNFGIRANFRLGARNSATAQRWSASFQIGAEGAALNWGGVSNLWNVHRMGFLTVDSTIDQILAVTTTWSAASVSNSVNSEGFEIHRLR